MRSRSCWGRCWPVSPLAALWRRHCSRATGSLALLTIVQLAIALLAVLSPNVLTVQQAAGAWLVPPLTALGIDPYVAPIIVASLLAMLPTTILLGFGFPIGLSLWAGSGAGSSRRIGTFYSLNVCGAIIGSVLGGFVLLPLLGSRGSLIASAALALVSSRAGIEPPQDGAQLRRLLGHRRAGRLRDVRAQFGRPVCGGDGRTSARARALQT